MPKLVLNAEKLSKNHIYLKNMSGGTIKQHFGHEIVNSDFLGLKSGMKKSNSKTFLPSTLRTLNGGNLNYKSNKNNNKKYASLII